MFSTRAKSKSSSPLSPPWTELPGDLTANILQRLHTEEILTSVQLVCSTWWRVCKNPAMWRVINLDIRRCHASCNFGTICSCEAHEAVCFGDCAVDKCEVLCRCVVDQFLEIGRCAVDRSQGQLVDLKLAGFDVHELLNYVVQRHCQLRCLTLVEYQSFDELETTPLTVQLIKLRQLEELHLYTKSWVDPEDFETIGIACPMLKSFTYHNCFIRGPDFVDYVAAIGKTMPNLHHLRLCQNLTGNKGLELILDGCPNLKSFDLRRCSGLDEQGERCSEKDRWLCDDSISLMEWVKEWQENYDTDIGVYASDLLLYYNGTCCDVFDWNYFYYSDQ